MQIQDQDLLLWGHSLQEYQQMFDLTSADLNKPTLDCASGFSSFNAEMHRQAKLVTSVDKAYDLPIANLRNYMEQGLKNVLKKIAKNKEQFNWHLIGSIDELKKQKETMLDKFFLDFQKGKAEGRYVTGTLPQLPFPDNQFKLALCAYFLFITELSLQFHLDAIKDMCRIAGECRIYPLIDDNGDPSELLAPIMLTLQQNNYGVEIKQVPYEFQKGSNAMLRVWLQACEV